MFTSVSTESIALKYLFFFSRVNSLGLGLKCRFEVAYNRCNICSLCENYTSSNQLSTKQYWGKGKGERKQYVCRRKSRIQKWVKGKRGRNVLLVIFLLL